MLMHSTDKNTAFSEIRTLRFQSKEIRIDRPLVMGILNLTPDSFYDGGKHPGQQEILSHVEKMIRDGAALIDIGAMTTKPNSEFIREDIELERLIPVIRLLKKSFPEMAFSVDTFRASVAKACIEEGIMMINDISGGTFDEEMPSLIGHYNIPYVMMHIHGTPATMQNNPLTIEAEKHVHGFFEKQIEVFLQKGARHIILDPGFGFGKNVEGNFMLLKNLSNLKKYGFPILVGLSRKSMICRLLDVKPTEALNGTTVLNTIALLNGASILRVHDVKEAVESIALVRQLFAEQL